MIGNTNLLCNGVTNQKIDIDNDNKFGNIWKYFVRNKLSCRKNVKFHNRSMLNDTF